MAYIKYKELTKYYHFSEELDVTKLPEYTYNFIEDNEALLLAYADGINMFIFTSRKLIVFEVNTLLNKHKVHFFPYNHISSTAIETIPGRLAIYLSMDSGYQVRLNFVKLTKEEQEKIKRVYMRMIKTISTKRVRIN